MASLPDVVDAGSVELHRWRAGDLDQVLDAVRSSLPELGRWLPWARSPPDPAAQLDVLRAGEAAFTADTEWAYVLREVGTGELVGAVGLHPRAGPDTLEIGYWVRSDRTGRGYATAAARALTVAAFAHRDGVEQVVVRMDAANLASAAVPRKLGFRLAGEEGRPVEAPGQTGRGLVWTLGRAEVGSLLP